MRLILKNKLSTGNAETVSAMVKIWDHRDSAPGNVKAWKATRFRPETESLHANLDRSGCGHMRTVIGKGSVEGPVSGEDSLSVEQSNYFEKVIYGYVGRATRAAETGRMHSNATNANSNRICSISDSSFRSTTHERSPSSLVPRIMSKAKITRNVMVKCSRKHSTQAVR